MKDMLHSYMIRLRPVTNAPQFSDVDASEQSLLKQKTGGGLSLCPAYIVSEFNSGNTWTEMAPFRLFASEGDLLFTEEITY